MRHQGTGLTPYASSSGQVPAGSVPVTVVVLARDEELVVGRALRSAAWAEQVLVVDSGSQDATVPVARAAGAELLHRPWQGYASQREWALRHPAVRHDWVFFLDADEWVSDDLASEIADAVAAPRADAYRARFRLVFQGRWIRHCGWYEGSRQVRLVRRAAASYRDAAEYGERVVVDGRIADLRCDFVDEDLKGLRRWLHKHVEYATAEAELRGQRERVGTARRRAPGQPLGRWLAKEVVWPRTPAKPVVIFLYMYVLRSGFRDGRPGLVFSLLRGGWFELVVGQLQRERERSPDPRS